MTTTTSLANLISASRKTVEQAEAQLVEFGWTRKDRDAEDSQFHFPYEF